VALFDGEPRLYCVTLNPDSLASLPATALAAAGGDDDGKKTTKTGAQTARVNLCSCLSAPPLLPLPPDAPATSVNAPAAASLVCLE